MFYHFIYPLSEYISALNLFRYITFRSITAALIAMGLTILLGRFYILKMTQKNHQPRKLTPKTHEKKKGTPSMGGLVIIAAVLITLLVTGRWDNPYTILALCTLIGFAGIGFIDDYIKHAHNHGRGLYWTTKLACECLLAFFIIAAIVKIQPTFTLLDADKTTLLQYSKVIIPFTKDTWIDLRSGYWLLAIIVIIASSNSVNLSDGLDGLAVGLSLFILSAFIVITYATGHSIMAMYLKIPHLSNIGELTVFLSALAGSCLGFLWYNAHPAEMFMGDTGSLALGGTIGLTALLLKEELLLPIVGGVFVLEALSVIIQVTYFKLTKKRFFKMAPLHHHFELLGIKESKIIARFWIMGAILALVAIASLKIR
ncbi:phospho-N-acetylmuramoyl-pentapeptide-transferase [Spirochaetota bacterium]|nr:phospho-N-acetylmuramoyl-pentapeptide-transferase [Spirochaetota bacterium]